MTDSPIEADYWAARRQAGLIELAAWGAIEVRGADRAGFLHRLLTNAIAGLAEGSGCEAALTNATAKLVAHMLVLAGREAHWLLMERVCLSNTLNALAHYVITEDVRLRDRSDGIRLLSLQGPASAKVIEQALGIAAQPTMPHHHAAHDVEGVSVRIVTASFTGQPGALLIVPTDNAEGIHRRLLDHGEPLGVRSIGEATFELLRIEAGLPRYGIEMDETSLLPETGLETRAVSYTKGCYVGQEVIARMDTYGSASRKLMGMRCEGSIVPQPGDSILINGGTIGQITSAAYSPSLRQPIALGYVKRPLYEPGREVTIMRGASAICARLAQRPLVPPEPERG